MDKNRIEGAVDQAKGSLKEALGKVPGNEKLQAEGLADKVTGKTKSALGEAKDAVRDVARK